MYKNFQIESRKDFRFGVYSRDEPIGLGESYFSIMKKRVEDKNKPKAKYLVI